MPDTGRTSRYIVIMTTQTLHDRLSTVASGQTYRALSQMTETHPETVRRYMQGQSPSVEFLAAVCSTLAINADWLLTGRGPQRADEVRTHALKHANPDELHRAIASTISTLVERVNRLETYCQTLETQMRAARAPKPSDHSNSSATLSSTEDGPADPPEIVTRAKRIANAVAKRPHYDAGGDSPPDGS